MHAVDRRAFLRATAMFGAGAALLDRDLLAFSSSAPPHAPIAPWSEMAGIQLYTVRDRMSSDPERTLARLAEIGYKHVEYFNYGGQSPSAVRAMLDRTGLTAPSTHVRAAPGPELEKTLAGFAEMGHKYCAVGGGGGGGVGRGAAPGAAAGAAPAPRPAPPTQTVESIRRQIEQVNAVGAAGAAFGIRALIHNHTNEFETLEDGRTPHALMLAELDPAHTVLELDIGWATVAGIDALTQFAKHAGRYPLWHVKDMAGLSAVTAISGMSARQRAATIVPVGQGEIDYKPIFAKAKVSGLQYFFVEQDTAPDSGDSLAAAKISFDALKARVG